MKLAQAKVSTKVLSRKFAQANNFHSSEFQGFKNSLKRIIFAQANFGQSQHRLKFVQANLARSSECSRSINRSLAFSKSDFGNISETLAKFSLYSLLLDICGVLREWIIS